MSRRPRMDKLIPAEYAYIPASKAIRLRGKTRHEKSMRLKQVFQGCRVERWQSLVGLYGVLHFQDIPGRRKHTLVVYNRRDLLKREAVVLNCQ